MRIWITDLNISFYLFNPFYQIYFREWRTYFPINPDSCFLIYTDPVLLKLHKSGLQNIADTFLFLKLSVTKNDNRPRKSYIAQRLKNNFLITLRPSRVKKSDNQQKAATMHSLSKGPHFHNTSIKVQQKQNTSQTTKHNTRTETVSLKLVTCFIKVTYQQCML